MKIHLLFLLAFFIVSCKTVRPLPPANELKVVPVSPCPVSDIILPVRINIEPYLKTADESVEKYFEGKESPCSGVSYAYHFDREPLQFNGYGRNVTTTVNGRYRIKMSYCPECTGIFTSEPLCLVPRIPFSCGYNEPMRRINIQFSSGIELTKDYGFATKTKVSAVNAIDPCEVTVFSFDATEALLKEIRKSLDKLASDIDRETGKISFKKEASQMWKLLSEPIHIPGFGFLTLQPQKIAVTQPEVNGKFASCNLRLTAQPAFSTYPLNSTGSKLPPLHIDENYTNDTLSVYSDMRLNYDSLSTIINHYAQGQEIILKGRKIIIDSIGIKGPQNENLIFSMAFSGDKRGTIYIIGKPVFDAATQTIELVNVDFDIETKSVLLKTAKWLFNDRILDEITKSSKQDLSVQLAKLQKELNKALKFEKNGFLLSGSVHQIRVEHLYPEMNDLIVRVAAKGKVKLISVD